MRARLFYSIRISSSSLPESTVQNSKTMGCASSKRIEATLVSDVYHPAPAGFAVFDINAIEEPWLKADDQQQQQQQQQHEKPTIVPAPILEKLDAFELASKGPHSWSDVSKALEDLKPTLDNSVVSIPVPQQHPSSGPDLSSNSKSKPDKSLSFHTLEELDSKLSSPKPTQLKKAESMTRVNDSTSNNNKKPELKVTVTPPPIDSGGFKPVKENLFLIKDRLEREKEGKNSNLERLRTLRRDPLSDYTEKCPPGGADRVVLYTTTLRGVRRTFEDCNQARSILEGHQVGIDERDVSLHGEFLNELRELLGEEGSVPRLFVKGRYIGGVEKMMELNETGRLGRILRLVGMDGTWRECEGCGGARFVPCLECGGSCKVMRGNMKERCPKCNENGLIMCPLCH
ncbi:hypothetical protein NE237_028437 [Protea cynaroides]|uniref:Glutaredoxin domain-containing protein n=1 Tax=Protea cynaroides TaxID=273540 RepID=A0A9Q0JV52_9MAGN|nr:hypothetical protein NE237_028437 [Protea cynaroides]